MNELAASCDFDLDRLVSANRRGIFRRDLRGWLASGVALCAAWREWCVMEQVPGVLVWLGRMEVLVQRWSALVVSAREGGIEGN